MEEERGGMRRGGEDEGWREGRVGVEGGGDEGWSREEEEEG